jgi:hypothetical protein
MRIQNSGKSVTIGLTVWAVEVDLVKNFSKNFFSLKMSLKAFLSDLE